jgi:hypothetical protein
VCYTLEWELSCVGKEEEENQWRDDSSIYGGEMALSAFTRIVEKGV